MRRNVLIVCVSVFRCLIFFVHQCSLGETREPVSEYYLKEKHEMSIKVMHFLREHAFNHRLNTELFEVIVLLTRANEDNR